MKIKVVNKIINKYNNKNRFQYKLFKIEIL